MDFSKIGQAAAASEDLTADHSKSFVRELPRAGVALCRLLEYIELGRHEPNNPNYKPSLKTLLVFELSHPDHMIEIGGERVPSKITVRINKTLSDKGKYMPLFKQMNRACGNRFTHFAQMIGQPFLATVTHSEDGKYANLSEDGVFTFKEAVQVDAISGTRTPVPVPELHNEPRVFLWENAGISEADYVAMWDSLHIDGTRDDGSSKNWIQNTIREAIDFQGSTLEALVDKPFVDDLGSDDSIY